MKNKFPFILLLFPVISIFTSYFLYDGLKTGKVFNVATLNSDNHQRICNLEESPLNYWLNMGILSFSTIGGILGPLYLWYVIRRNSAYSSKISKDTA
ncbi:MAG: hypothetical protein VX130_01430 [Verrucomicrobiota bacterium]|nr:hypothetical protein [Verrucomicrobiota bacterium]